MRFKLYSFVFFLCLSLFSVEAHAQSLAADPDIDYGAPETLMIKSGGQTHAFMVEIADDAAERAQGMMFRDAMDPDTGMLFEFDQTRVASIWMKNTNIPLDILFVKDNGRIFKIVHSATPLSLTSHTSEAPVSAVLELAGGRSKELGIAPGDVVLHTFFGNVDDAQDIDPN